MLRSGVVARTPKPFLYLLFAVYIKFDLWHGIHHLLRDSQMVIRVTDQSLKDLSNMLINAI